jgi:hypothetical protein
MIITDPIKRPSQRFIDIIHDTFINDNYTLIKSSHSYKRFTTSGFEQVGIQFYTSVNLVSVSISWSKSLTHLEKLYNLWNGSHKYKNNSTCYADLMNYTRFEKNPNHTWDLFDRNTLRCDDVILNMAAEGFMNAYNKYVAPFFQKFDNLCNLEIALNNLPISYPPFSMGHLGYSKQFSIGLCLAKYCEKNDFEKLVEEYLNFTNKTIHPDLQQETLESISRTLEFLKETNIKSLLTN